MRSTTRRARLVAIATILSVSATIPAHAFHVGDDAPVVIELPLEDGTWFRLDVSFEQGASFDIDTIITAPQATTTYEAGWILWGDWMSLWFTGMKEGQALRISSSTTGVVAEQQTTASPHEVGGTWLFGEQSEPGHFTYVGFVVTDALVSSGSLRIRGTGVEVDTFATGDDAVLIQDEDFSSPLYARGPDGIPEAGVDATASVVTERPTFAWMPTFTNAHVAEYNGPGGRLFAVPESLPIMLDGVPAGTHEFMLHAGAGVHSHGWDLIAAGIDLG